jgi:hypothetical protein
MRHLRPPSGAQHSDPNRPLDNGESHPVLLFRVLFVMAIPPRILSRA